MAETQRIPPSSRQTGWVVGTLVAVVLCLGVTLCLGGLGTWGGVTYYFTRSTARAAQTQLARLAEAATTTQVAARDQLATGTAMVTAAPLANWAASTATAQARVEASTATAQARAAGPATPLASATVAQAWPLRLLDTFDTNVNSWPTSPRTDDLGSLNRSIKSGKYRWEATTTQGGLWRVNYTEATVSDLYLAADVLLVTGDANTRYGLVLRDDAQNYYYFDAGQDGTFGFYLRFDGQWTTLVGVTPAASLEANAVNRLAVLAQGERFTLYINGQAVAQAVDNRIAQGMTGVAVNLNGKTSQGVYEFDNVELRAP